MRVRLGPFCLLSAELWWVAASPKLAGEIASNALFAALVAAVGHGLKDTQPHGHSHTDTDAVHMCIQGHSTLLIDCVLAIFFNASQRFPCGTTIIIT